MLYLLQILIIAVSFSSCSEDEPTGGENPENPDNPITAGHYRNPFTAENENVFTGGEGIADPATFRWMGKYYLF